MGGVSATGWAGQQAGSVLRVLDQLKLRGFKVHAKAYRDLEARYQKGLQKAWVPASGQGSIHLPNSTSPVDICAMVDGLTRETLLDLAGPVSEADVLNQRSPSGEAVAEQLVENRAARKAARDAMVESHVR